MGDVPFYFQSGKFFLGHRDNSVTASFISQEQDLLEDGPEWQGKVA